MYEFLIRYLNGIHFVATGITTKVYSILNSTTMYMFYSVYILDIGSVFLEKKIELPEELIDEWSHWLLK